MQRVTADEVGKLLCMGSLLIATVAGGCESQVGGIPDPRSDAGSDPYVACTEESEPTAVARILSVNGDTDLDTAPRIAPLDDVVLTGEDSSAPALLQVEVYQWEIVLVPTGSHGFLDDPSSMTPRFVFDNMGEIVTGIDLAGFWTVRLSVVDNCGAASTNEATVRFSVIPP